MNKNIQIIKLVPALPWVASKGYAGFVKGMGEQLLRLIIPVSDARILPKDARLTVDVMIDDENVIRVSGTLQVVKHEVNTFDLNIDGDESRHALADLLTRQRKEQHIEICSTRDVEASDRFTGFDQVSFMPSALPELDYDQVDTQARMFGRSFALPIMIAGMTGGVERAEEINRILAETAASFGIPMGIGSQRIALENSAMKRIFDVKRTSSNLFLVGNLGCAQLLADNGLDLCKNAIEMIGADALAIHVNVVQECVQVEGDRNFIGLIAKIATLCADSKVPIIIKEVGAGIDPFVAKRLYDVGVRHLDIGGKGGTSWPHIEGLRSLSRDTHKVAETFRNWGIPTAFSLAAVRRALPAIEIIATGGVRSGLDVAKALALGANMVGMGLPFLRAALAADHEPLELLQTIKRELKITMLATASRTIAELGRNICLSKHPMEGSFQTSFQGGFERGHV